VAAQVAISLALLFCATLLVRSLANVSALDRGFDSRAVVVARLHPRPGGYRTINNSVYYPDLARRVSELPGVESVAMSQYFPVANVDRPRPVMSEGSGEPLVVQAAREAVSPRFFETMGISLLQGRDFSWLDDQGKPAVCILNATLASQLFPATSAIGRRIRVGQAPQVQVMEIVGIAGDVPVRGIHVPLLFRPQLQEPALARQPALALRTRLTGAEIGPMLRRVVPAAGHEYVLDLRTLNDYVNISMAQERLAAPIAALFGWIAMGLVFAGQYSLLAMSVTRRTHEIGVRLALGASTASVLRLILRDGIGITTLGIVVGIPIAASLGHAASAFLFGVSPTDPLVLLGAIVVIVSVTTAACVVPSHRACGVSPLVSMSTE
jgi:predicted permease